MAFGLVVKSNGELELFFFQLMSESNKLKCEGYNLMFVYNITYEAYVFPKNNIKNLLLLRERYIKFLHFTSRAS